MHKLIFPTTIYPRNFALSYTKYKFTQGSLSFFNLKKILLFLAYTIFVNCKEVKTYNIFKEVN